MTDPTLAPSLARGRATLNKRYPKRDHTMDGWIGDAAHQARQSDHNPNARNIVDALDIDMYGGQTPVHRQTVIAGAIMHPATHYVIHDQRIYNREAQFRPRLYIGDNPHEGHCHVSIMQTAMAERNPAPWPLWAVVPSWPSLQLHAEGQSVAELQAYLNAYGSSLVVDGDFGPKTDSAVRALQRNRRVVVDGIVGPVTRGLILPRS